MATTVNKSPSGVQTRFTRSRPPPITDIPPQITTRNSTTRRQANDISRESMTSINSYLRPRRGVEYMDSGRDMRDDGTNNDSGISYKEDEGTFMDTECDMVINGQIDGHDIDNEGSEGDPKTKSGKHLRTMVNRLAPTPGFVDKNSLPSDLTTRSRVKRVASLNAAAKSKAMFINEYTTHSKKIQGEGDFEEIVEESSPHKQRGRPRLASISTNNSNFRRTPEDLDDNAHGFIGNPVAALNSENAVAVKQMPDNSASLKRLHEADAELYEAKRAKYDRRFMKRNYEQNGDYNTIITHRRILKGKEVVDVGLQVKIPKIHPNKNPDSSIQCTCRPPTVVDIPLKSYVSTYANGTLVSIPITKTHRLNPQVPEKPLPELAQGDLANRSKRVAGLNSRAMLNAILCEERHVPPEQDVAKPARRQLLQKKSYYEHGLSNTVPSKLKIPKINFAATSTSNFGGRKILGPQKTSTAVWPKSGIASHDGPKRTNGWCYLGAPIVKPYYYNEVKVMRKYYIGIQRNDEVIYVRDSVLLKSGPRRKDLPFVARVSGFWEEAEGPHAGEMMMSVLWYYRPEQTEMGMQPDIHGENEILASRHKDDNSVACIVDKCYVLSYPEYCRHKAAVKRSQDSRISSANPVPPAELSNTTRDRIPSTCDPKLVFFCRQIYDYRMGRILKNPLYV